MIRDPKKSTLTKGRQRTAKKGMEVDLRREKVMELTLQGLSLRQIAERLNCHKNTVDNDRRVVHQDCLTRTKARFDELVAQEVAQFDLITNKAWEAWEKSVKEGTGDAKYLDTIIKARKEVIQLLRLNHVDEVGEEYDPDVQVVEVVVKSREQVPKIMTYGEFEELQHDDRQPEASAD